MVLAHLMCVLALAAAPEPDGLEADEAPPKLPRSLASLFAVGWQHTFSWTVSEPNEPTRVVLVTCTSTSPGGEEAADPGVDLRCTGAAGDFVIALRLGMEGLSLDPAHIPTGADESTFASPELSHIVFELPLRAARQADEHGGQRVARSGDMWCRHDWARTEIDTDERVCVDGRGIVRWSYGSYAGRYVLRLVKRTRVGP